VEGTKKECAHKAVNQSATAIAFGRFYIANPDLVERFAAGLDLAAPNEKTIYTPMREGYCDYPSVNI